MYDRFPQLRQIPADLNHPAVFWTVFLPGRRCDIRRRGFIACLTVDGSSLRGSTVTVAFFGTATAIVVWAIMVLARYGRCLSYPGTGVAAAFLSTRIRRLPIA